jgi:TonB-linked SusC/RagA family outer membrane protein
VSRRPSSVVVVLVLVVASLAATAAPVLAQRRITGRVTDQASGLPIASVTVTVSGTTTGALTNDQGAFTLPVPEGPTTLLLRRIGYERRLLPVGPTESTVAVMLVRDVLRLETEVVTGTATAVSRRNAANDVAQVSAEQIAAVPSSSVESALAGRVAGAQIVANSGAPGGGNQVRLRGVTSVFGSADPLYVVDGVIVSNDAVQPGTNALSAAARASSNASNQDNGVNRVADLNPNDIESIDILKGASASAIYGSRASNGVIIIRTKGGGNSQPVVDLVQRFGTRELSNKFGARRFTLAEAETFGTARGLTVAEVRDNYARCNGYCDFEQELFGERPFNYETSLSVRGGTPQGTTYFVSGLALHDGGIQKNTGYDKQTIRLNLGQTLGGRVTAQLNSNLVRTLTRRGISNNDNANITPYFVFAGTPSFFDMRPRDGVYPTNPFAVTNSFQNADFVKTPEEVYRIITAGRVSLSALRGETQTLELRLDGGIDRFNQQDNIVSPRFLYFEPNDGLPGTVTSLSGNVVQANLNLAAVHTWTPRGRSLTATGSLGMQREIAERRSTNIVTRDVVAGQENVNRGAATEAFADRSAIRGLALFAQEEILAFGEKLLLTGGARAERNTVNGDVNRFYVFPKASISLRLASPLSFIDEIKPRVAVGQSGNQPLYIQKYSPALASTYQGQNALQPGLIHGNPDVRPERQTEIEGGFDATFLDSRASLAVTVYQKTIRDVILHFVSAPSLGYNVDIRNGGSIRNRGTEALVAFTPVRRASLTWVSTTTFARNIGIVTSLPAGVTAFNVERDASGQRVAFGAGYGLGRLEVGKRVTQIVASGCDGACVEAKADAAPRFTMGFSNDVTWGRLRVGTLLDWQPGAHLVNITQNVYDGGGLAPDRPDGGAGRARENDVAGNAQYVENATFVKLRELSLSYALPARLVGRALGSGAHATRLELSGRNLVTWTKYPGVDPEVSNFGSQQISRFIDLAPFPPSRTYYLTLAASF